jgi:hypothetical protein
MLYRPETVWPPTTTVRIGTGRGSADSHTLPFMVYDALVRLLAKPFTKLLLPPAMKRVSLSRAARQ